MLYVAVQLIKWFKETNFPYMHTVQVMVHADVIECDGASD